MTALYCFSAIYCLDQANQTHSGTKKTNESSAFKKNISKCPCLFSQRSHTKNSDERLLDDDAGGNAAQANCKPSSQYSVVRQLDFWMTGRKSTAGSRMQVAKYCAERDLS
jgi:hypothetical protein